jgi:5-methylcytosine-specific restriction endonuclease McrA
MIQNVIVLNADMGYLNTITWQDAVCLLYKGVAEPAIPHNVDLSLLDPKLAVEVVQGSDTIPYRIVRGVKRNFIVPLVIRLVKYVRAIFKAHVPFKRTNVFIRDGYECQYCGTDVTEKNAELEHVIPRSKGGDTSWENCVTACRKCNQKKADRNPREAGMILKRKVYYQPTIHEWFDSKMRNSGVLGILKEFNLR